ncbi:hypothetical protein ACFW23_04650 [Streptomyces rochei]
MILAACFALLALGALVALALVEPRAVPRLSGTCALILTAAAFVVAMHR